MGWLSALWQLDVDPTDGAAPYTPYSFVPLGHRSPINMSMQRDFGRRESIMSVPSMDGVLSGHGRRAGPTDVRYVTFSFRVFTADLDAAYDLLAAQVAPGVPQRLVYQMDSGALWFTIGYTPSIKQTVTAANSWGAGGYCDFAVTWRIRPDWRPRYSETAPPTYSATNSEVYRTDNSETYSMQGVTNITLATTPFTMDSTGVAGVNLPTIDDTGPAFYITGPAGGSLGIAVANYSAMIADKLGVMQPTYFTIPFNLPTAHDTAYCDFAKQSFYHNGTPFRPLKPDYQHGWFIVKAGIVNQCTVGALGTSPLTGGQITHDFWRKRA